MADKVTIYSHYLEEVKKLSKELCTFRDNNTHFYANVMEEIMKRYNSVLKKYHKSSGIPLELLNIYDYEYSQSKKTVNGNCTDRVLLTFESTMNILSDMIENERNCDVGSVIPEHQMRRCPKIGVNRCPKNPHLERNKVFVGMPFRDEYKDSYNFGIKLALEALGINHFIANEKIGNRDIMCKICYEMQSSRILLFNISGLNPNVMMELGLSYGLGKETIIIKDKNTENISDLSNTEYIEYAHAGELQDKLRSYFERK